MKFTLSLVTLVTSLLVVSVISSKQSSAQAKNPAQQDAEQIEDDKPKLIHIYVEQIEISALEYAEYMTKPSNSDNQTALRNKLLKDVKEGKAKLTANQSLVSRSSEKATTESIREFIYATEAEPAETLRPREGDTAEQIANFPVLPPTPTAFETRNLGFILEVEPTLREDGETIDVRFAPESTKHVGENVFSEWNTKEAKMRYRMPIFYTMRTNSAFTVRNGEFLLINTNTPDKEGMPDHSRKVLVFIRAEVLTNDHKK